MEKSKGKKLKTKYQPPNKKTKMNWGWSFWKEKKWWGSESKSDTTGNK